MLRKLASNYLGVPGRERGVEYGNIPIFASFISRLTFSPLGCTILTCIISAVLRKILTQNRDLGKVVQYATSSSLYENLFFLIAVLYVHQSSSTADYFSVQCIHVDYVIPTTPPCKKEFTTLLFCKLSLIYVHGIPRGRKPGSTNWYPIRC